MCSDSVVRLFFGASHTSEQRFELLSREVLINKRFLDGVLVGSGWNVHEQDRFEKGTVAIHYIRDESSNGAAFLT